MAKTVLRSAAIIMIMTLISRVIGFIRDMFMAHEFGVGFLADAYSLAFTIPNTLFLFIPGALNAIFIPSLKGLLTENKYNDARALFRKLLTFITVFYFLLALFGIFYSKEIVQILAPTYDEEQVRITTYLMQIMWPSAVFISLIGLFQATLNAHQHFLVPMVSTIVNSLVIIAAYPIFVPHYGIYGVAIGTTLGFAFAAFTMLPSIIHNQYSLKPDFYWRTTEMKKIGERFLPIMFGSLITQSTVFIERFLASDLGDGKISSLKYAFTIYQLPMAIFVTAFTLPIFPYLVEYYKKKQLTELKNSITEGMQFLFILMTPTIFAIIVLAPEMISFVYQWGEEGAFDESGVALTSPALIFYSLGLFFLAGRDLLTRVFYAMENTITPVITAVISIAVFVISSILLIPFLDHGGIALGTSISSLANMLILWFLLRGKFNGVVNKSFWHTLWKTLLASGVMVIFLLICKATFSFEQLWVHKLYMLILIGLGALVFGMTMLLLKEQKVVDILQRLKVKR